MEKKRKKLTISELKLQSFVTELQAEHAYTAKGGDDCMTLSNIGDVISCVSTVYNIYKDPAKERSWWPYHCGSSSSKNPGGGGSTSNPDPGEGITIEYQSCSH